jgi:transcriptional regulator with XRE-family HTH domain
MAGKQYFTPEQYDILREAAGRARKKFKTQQEFALALGITQPALSSMLKGRWKPGLTTANHIAEALGVTLDALVGPHGGTTATQARDGVDEATPFPNMGVCLRFYQGQKSWSPWTIAAAKAGYFGAKDVAGPDWVERLDKLEMLLGKGRK